MSEPTKRADMFLDLAEDPREDGTSLGDERTTLQEYLRCQRLTLQIKCSGLSAEQLARRSVPPSTMSLLGLVRHIADMERSWFRRRLAGEDVRHLFKDPEHPDDDFDKALPDQRLVDQAWQALAEQQGFTDAFIQAHDDLAMTVDEPQNGPLSLREILVHVIEEYARHNGHADLLRECIDGRVGQ